MRLDQAVFACGLCRSRSEAESWIRLGRVMVDGRVETAPGFHVDDKTKIELKADQRYVSRAGLKLASVADHFAIDFRDKVVLDVGSSTGGFTDFALRHGASRVIAVDIGTNQLHPSLRGDSRIELIEKLDIRQLALKDRAGKLIASSANIRLIEAVPDIVVIDVSFVSLRLILPHIANYLCDSQTTILAMVKPQFEAQPSLLSRGVVKNNAMRRQILRQFEDWAKAQFVIVNKLDSSIRGDKGNLERFYQLRLAKTSTIA